jgi:hypothetical protein
MADVPLIRSKPQTIDGEYRVVGQTVREPFINLHGLINLGAYVLSALCYGAAAYVVSKAVHWAFRLLAHGVSLG